MTMPVDAGCWRTDRFFPEKGRNHLGRSRVHQETGTFLLTRRIANPKGELKPGQLVRVGLRLHTAKFHSQPAASRCSRVREARRWVRRRRKQG